MYFLCLKCIRQGSMILPFDMSISGNGSTLVINSVTTSDSGTYTCIASNVQGNTNHSIFLRVQGNNNLQSISIVTPYPL